MKSEETDINRCKTSLEQAMARDAELGPLTQQLDHANTQFKTKVKQANVHLAKPKPKAKPKAKAKAMA